MLVLILPLTIRTVFCLSLNLLEPRFTWLSKWETMAVLPPHASSIPPSILRSLSILPPSFCLPSILSSFLPVFYCPSSSLPPFFLSQFLPCGGPGPGRGRLLCPPARGPSRTRHAPVRAPPARALGALSFILNSVSDPSWPSARGRRSGYRAGERRALRAEGLRTKAAEPGIGGGGGASSPGPTGRL